MSHLTCELDWNARPRYSNDRFFENGGQAIGLHTVCKRRKHSPLARVQSQIGRNTKKRVFMAAMASVRGANRIADGRRLNDQLTLRAQTIASVRLTVCCRARITADDSTINQRTNADEAQRERRVAAMVAAAVADARARARRLCRADRAIVFTNSARSVKAARVRLFVAVAFVRLSYSSKLRVYDDKQRELRDD